jgi:hypothetical protein
MKPMIKGLILGFLLKEKIQEIFNGIVFNGLNIFHGIKNRLSKQGKLPNNSLIKNIYFVFKITDEESFNEYFKNNEKNNITLQPIWEYYSNKRIIKIPLDDDFVDYLNSISDYSIHFNDFVNIKSKSEYYVTLDIPFFETFGEVFLYVKYSVNDRNYINIYSGSDTICSDDFKIVNTDFKKFMENIICASVEYKKDSKKKIEYITNYIKMFVNNITDLTPELLLNNYDKLDVDLDTTNLSIITLSSENKKFSSNEFLKKQEQLKD